MPRVLIAGFGYVGRATGELFASRGWDVEGWTRTPASHAYIRTTALDISDPRKMPRDQKFDVIIQCASTRGGDAEAYRAIYLKAAQVLRAAFPSALMLFTSSTSVYAQREGEWVDERSKAEPTRETAKVLREAEEYVTEGGGIVARLAGIHGPGRSFLLRSFLNGARLQHDRFVNQVHRDDIASALFLLATDAAAGDASRIFNVVDDEPILRSACYDWLTRNVRRESVELTASESPRKRGDSNKRVSNARLRAAGWVPRFPTFAAAMEQSILPSLEKCGA